MKTQSKLSKKRITYAEQACEEIPGFRKLYKELEEKMVLSGQTGSTLSNYGRKLAHISLQFHKLPQDIPEKEINRYLAVWPGNRKLLPLAISNIPFMVCVFAIVCLA